MEAYFSTTDAGVTHMSTPSCDYQSASAISYEHEDARSDNNVHDDGHIPHVTLQQRRN